MTAPQDIAALVERLREESAHSEDFGLARLAELNREAADALEQLAELYEDAMNTAVNLGHALEACARDSARLDWLDANPRLVLRSGKQHMRPLIDAAMAAIDRAREQP